MYLFLKILIIPIMYIIENKQSKFIKNDFIINNGIYTIFAIISFIFSILTTISLLIIMYMHQDIFIIKIFFLIFKPIYFIFKTLFTIIYYLFCYDNTIFIIHNNTTTLIKKGQLQTTLKNPLFYSPIIFCQITCCIKRMFQKLTISIIFNLRKCRYINNASTFFK